MKKIKLPETNISKVSLALVAKLAASILLVIIPAVFTIADQMSAPLWIQASLEVITICVLLVYAVVPTFSAKMAFGITIPICIFLILAMRVVFIPPFNSPIIKYASQILCIAAICLLVELNRYIDSYKKFQFLALSIFGLLFASSILISWDFYKVAGGWDNSITGVWLMFLTVLCVLITYHSTIRKRNNVQNTDKKKCN